MSQDTRKDPRAKVLTMTVRYKSATLDEFIEHHSYDVSRGGMFIKTPSPFPPGTLLKFEVKIAADQRVIQGVGRVVWKRDSETHGGDPRPAGMGVKFIKIDDASRTVIDALIDSRGDAMSAYDAGGGDGGTPAAPKTPGIAAEAPKVPNPRKATMIGLGAMNPSNRPPINAPLAPPSGSFFPETKSEAEMPAPEDRTVMRQARELLQDALAQTGSSLEDVAATPKNDAPPSSAAGASSARAGAPPNASEPLTAEPTPSTQRSEPPAEPTLATAAPTGAKAVSARPLVPVSNAPRERVPARKSAVSAAPASRRVSVPMAAPVDKGSGSGRIVVIVAALAAAAGIVFALSNGSAPAPATSASAEPAASLAPPVASDEVPADTAAAAPVESVAPVVSASAAPAASAVPAASAAPAVMPRKPVVAAVPRPAPVVVARPVAAAADPGEVIHRPFVPPVRPPLGANPTGEPSSPVPPSTEPGAQKPAVPVPDAPRPKPVEPAGDNPY